MVTHNQADADTPTAVEDGNPTTEDMGLNVDNIFDVSDFYSLADGLASMPVDPELSQQDKALSDEDEERFDDPDDVSNIIDPDSVEAEMAREAVYDDTTDNITEDDSSGETAPEATEGTGSEVESKTGDDEDEEDGDDWGRFRLRSNDLIEKEAFNLKGRNRDMPIEECLERAKAKLLREGKITAEESTNAEYTSGDSPNGMPATLDATEAEIARLTNLADEAYNDDLDFTKGKEYQAEVNKLHRHVGTLQLREFEQRQATQQQEISERQQTYRESESMARDLYDFTNDPNHAGYQRMGEIDARLKAANDPRFTDPNKPLLITQMAAAELGIAPKGKSKKPADKIAGKPPQTTAPVQPAGGNSRTQTQSNKEQLDGVIDGIKTMEDFEKFFS
jgi:hypothetical protein